jgi:hypothetical protein
MPKSHLAPICAQQVARKRQVGAKVGRCCSAPRAAKPRRIRYHGKRSRGLSAGRSRTGSPFVK